MMVTDKVHPAQGSRGRGAAPVQGEDSERQLYHMHYRSVLADSAMFVLRMPFLLTGSMTLVSEVIRSLFTFSASISAFCVLRAKRRGRFGHFDFGVGRIDQAVKLAAGLGLVLSALWIAAGIFARLGEPEAAASPLGLAFAAIVNAVNLTKNSILLAAMLHTGRNGSNVIHGAQVRARMAMVLSNLFLQATLTLAALARDAYFALLLDAAGAAFVTGAMLYYGVPMITRSLPVLLDAPVPAAVSAEIGKAAGRVVPDDEIVRIRTRRSDRGALAEIMVRGLHSVSLTSMGEVRRKIDAELRGAGQRVDVSVVLAPE